MTSILHDRTMTDEEKLERLYAMFPPSVEDVSERKMSVLYDVNGPVVRAVARKYAHRPRVSQTLCP